MSAQYAFVTIMPEIPRGILAVCRVILISCFWGISACAGRLEQASAAIFGAAPA
jgi:hypothetical protein